MTATVDHMPHIMPSFAYAGEAAVCNPPSAASGNTPCTTTHKPLALAMTATTGVTAGHWL